MFTKVSLSLHTLCLLYFVILQFSLARSYKELFKGKYVSHQNCVPPFPNFVSGRDKTFVDSNYYSQVIGFILIRFIDFRSLFYKHLYFHFMLSNTGPNRVPSFAPQYGFCLLGLQTAYFMYLSG